MYSPLTIANYFIKKSLDTGYSVTPMKLVKLVYIAHGWYLALTNKDLINEAVQAWRYGPVIDSVYHAYKHHGSGFITMFDSDSIDYIKKEDVKFLDRIWEVYKKYDGLQLSTITHQENTPWALSFKPNIEGIIIPNDLIRKHYKSKVNR